MGGENTTQNDQSPRKQPASAGGGDRLKRDEWSEGAVTVLLEAYESKWVLRNRAKFKGHDWEDVARSVSSRGNNSKSPKTQTQCKNKIESMKKRYRSESAAELSSWPLFSRLDHLLRGTNPPPPPPQPLQLAAVVKSSTMAVPNLQDPAVLLAHNQSQESTDVDAIVKENEGVTVKPCDQVTDKNNNNDHDNHQETNSSTPALYNNDRVKTTTKRKRRRRGKSTGWEEVSESMQWLADVVVRSEQARMDTLRDVERMRVEAEAKRGEMDVKRTEIIANTQLEIARLFAALAAKKC